MNCDLVIFDCDGVLVASERLVEKIEAQEFHRYGIPIDERLSRELFKGKTVREMVQAVERDHGSKLPSEWSYDIAMATAFGFVQGLKAVPGVREAILACVEHGLQVCVASQSPIPRIKLSLAVTGLDIFFGDNTFSSSMVQSGKPAPDLFLYAAKQMGVEPNRCFVVEDSPAGVIAAKSAGMKVFGYCADEDESQLKGAGAITFSLMEELPSLMSSI